MPTPLEVAIEAEAARFVARLVELVRRASIADVANLAGEASPARVAAPVPKARKAPSGTPSKRRRRSATDLGDLGERVMTLLARTGHPTPAKEIADALGVSLDALTRPLKDLREQGKLVKHGDKRATRYTLA